MISILISTATAHTTAFSDLCGTHLSCSYFSLFVFNSRTHLSLTRLPLPILARIFDKVRYISLFCLACLSGWSLGQGIWGGLHAAQALADDSHSQAPVGVESADLHNMGHRPRRWSSSLRFESAMEASDFLSSLRFDGVCVWFAGASGRFDGTNAWSDGVQGQFWCPCNHCALLPSPSFSHSPSPSKSMWTRGEKGRNSWVGTLLETRGKVGASYSRGPSRSLAGAVYFAFGVYFLTMLCWILLQFQNVGHLIFFCLKFGHSSYSKDFYKHS